MEAVGEVRELLGSRTPEMFEADEYGGFASRGPDGIRKSEMEEETCRCFGRSVVNGVHG